MVWDNSVSIATRYGLDGPRIESKWERDFPPALGPTQPPIQWVPGLSPGLKRLGRGVNYPLPSSTDVKERVELYLYSPSGPSWTVLGRTLPLPFNIRWVRVVSVTPRPPYLERVPRYPLDGPQNGPECFGEQKNALSLLGIERHLYRSLISTMT